MTTKELKEVLIEEHRRDLRLTVIAYGLIVAGLAILAILTYLFVWERFLDYVEGIKDSWNNENQIYHYIIPIAILTMLSYFVMNILRIAKRMKQIDLFIDKIEQGMTAAYINEQTIYKIILPLGKIKVNLCPVSFVSVTFDQEIKRFDLPIQPIYIPEMKTLLSGVGGAEVEEVNKAWYELYDGETTQTTQNTPLKSVQEFEHFVQEELQSDVEEIEEGRKKGKNTMLMYAVPTVLVVGGWMFFAFFMSSGKVEIDTNTILMGFGAVCLISYAISFIYWMKNKNKPIESTMDITFKSKVFKKIVHFINPNFKYIMHGHIGLPEFLEMGFFEQKSYDLEGNDQIIGKHSGVPFQVCDLSVTRKRNFTRVNEAPDTVLFGQVFIAKFNKSFQDEVFVIPKKLSSDAKLHTIYFGETVLLEDPEFMKMFDVYSSNQVEARYILSTSMMERIKDMAKQNGGEYMISFRNNRISIANHSKKNNFEVSLFKSITKNNMVTEFYEELCQQLQIIDDLKLNINIWK